MSDLRLSTAAVAILMFTSWCAHAQSAAPVTIVYDVRAREFKCWYEGDARPSPACAGNSRGYYAGIYFFRGQPVYLLYDGAHVIDLFSATLMVNDLVEPAIPIFGSISELPSIKTIGPATSTVLGSNIKNVAGPNNLLLNLTDILDKTSPDDFKKLIQSALLDPVATDEAVKALTYASSNAIANLNQVAGANAPVPMAVVTLSAEIKSLMGNAAQGVPPQEAQLGRLRDQYCYPVLTAAAATADPARDFVWFGHRLQDLSQEISKQNAIVEEAIALSIKQKAADLITQVTGYQDPKLGVFSKAVADRLNAFQTLFNNSGYIQAPGVIQQIGLNAAGYTPPTNPLLAAINARIAVFGNPANDNLQNLKANIASLVAQWSAIQDAIRTYTTIATYADVLKGYVQQADNIFNLQSQLNELSRQLIDAGAAANCVAQGMPLPPPYDRPSLGTWYGGKTITVELKQGTRLPFYDLAGIQTSTDVGVTRDAASPKPVTTAPQDTSATVAKTTFDIHNTYHFQLAAGFMRSWFDDVKYQVLQRTVTANGTSTTENFFDQTLHRSYRFQPTINLVYYPFAREFFPWKARWAGERRPLFLKEIGPTVGFSISDPTKDFFLGGAWVPRAGIGIQGGRHYGFVDRLPDGVTLGTALTSDVTHVEQRLEGAWYVGAIMHIQVFKDVFQVIFK